MPLDRREEEEALTQGIISSGQILKLRALSQSMGTASIFSMKNVLIFLGGLLGIGAISIWYSLNFKFTGWEIFMLAVGMGFGAILLTNFFLYSRKMPVPASLTAAFAVCAVTLAVFGLQVATGSWNEHYSYHDYHAYIDKRWLVMELSTIAAALVIVSVYRLPFITMPVALTLWYMSMDLAPFIAQYLPHPPQQSGFSDYISDWDFRLWVSVWFGFACMIGAFLVDIYTKGYKDFAFWPYLAGLLSFWFGLSLMHSNNEVSKFIYAMINVTLIFMGPFLMRKSFIVFGSIGVFMYIGEQAFKRFADSAGFLFVLLAIAGSLMALGFLWYRHEKIIEEKTAWMVPRKLRERWAVA